MACTTMATPPVIACVCTCWRWRWRAFRLLFRGFNFRGSPVNRKNFRPYSSHSVRSHQKKSQTSRTLKISWGSIAHHNFPRRCGISCARYMKKFWTFPWNHTLIVMQLLLGHCGKSVLDCSNEEMNGMSIRTDFEATSSWHYIICTFVYPNI